MHEDAKSLLASVGRELDAFCHSHGIRELALFGSALGSDFASDSDIDLLISFAPEVRIGLMGLSEMACELQRILGRRVDLVPRAGLKPRIREQILASAEPLYRAA